MIRWFQVSLAFNALLFVYTMYAYSYRVSEISELVKIPKIPRKDDVVDVSSTKFLRYSEEIEVPVELQSPMRIRIRQDVPVFISEESKWSNDYQVPNVVHYIWFNDKPSPLLYHHMLSILSAYKFIGPIIIKFHCDRQPSGKYWRRVKKLPNFKVVERKPPYELYGEKVKEPKFYTSHSNVDRLKILSEEGGIYLDLDVLVTKSFNDLRHFACTIGQEQETKACGSVIVCSKYSLFLRIWINSYLDDYRMDEWAYNTGKVPYNLATRYPNLVNMEKTKLNHPNFNELDKIWGPDAFDWRQNYAVHIWYRLWKERSKHFKGVEPNDENIKQWQGAFGEMARVILFGKPDKIED